MFKYEEKLSSFIESFFYSLGYSIPCFLDSDFAYYPTTQEISYSLIESHLLDLAYKQFCKSHFNFEIPCLMFTFSLLHELGHYITLSGINKNRIRKIRKAKKYITKIKCDTADDIIRVQLSYCNLLDEKLATTEAVRIIRQNPELIKQFDTDLFHLLKSFYIANKICN